MFWTSVNLVGFGKVRKDSADNNQKLFNWKHKYYCKWNDTNCKALNSLKKSLVDFHMLQNN